MGAANILEFGQLTLEFTSTGFHNNHSRLFLHSDLTPVVRDYVDDDGNLGPEERPTYVRKLGGMLQRLELLGYTLAACGAWYKREVERLPGESEQRVSFETFCDELRLVDASRKPVHDDLHWDGDFANAIRRAAKSPWLVDAVTMFADTVDPYMALRLLPKIRRTTPSM